MANKSIAVIVLCKDGAEYKLHTVSLSNDRSVHIIESTKDHLLRTNQSQLIPRKATYHSSGFDHFTEGTGRDKGEVFPRKGDAFDDVTASKGLLTYMLKNSPNRPYKSYDVFKPKSKYKNVIKIDFDRYEILTLKYFLTAKDFVIKKQSDYYDEVFVIEGLGFNIVLTTINTSGFEEYMYKVHAIDLSKQIQDLG